MISDRKAWENVRGNSDPPTLICPKIVCNCLVADEKDPSGGDRPQGRHARETPAGAIDLRGGTRERPQRGHEKDPSGGT